ncbi:TIGR01777 family oxidoreductase [Pelagicoccus enzymogenes]|uniref:TIGR01777 family oxidoreductase n=1 Tax=Pelagicoccus enzymogenes TaxID=2773457 RepID=UPI00280C81D8|nr:TIGR01777 family oxidoreductase [Pelagicoccus enzymogenes]MDQ8198965.1 TIGR01777 family oxidoreductase [Pelagicoccus enzymogenes]
MKKLVIAGGTGFLGQALARHFTRKNWEVVILTRNTQAPALAGRLVAWDGKTLGPWVQELEKAQALVNLSGKSVDCRYHPRNRREIRESRLAPTRVLSVALQNAKAPPSVWLNAASATIYRHSLDTPMPEEDGEIGNGFSVEVCQAWEKALFEATLPGIRRIALRTSMVLGHAKNSVYPILARIARCGLGGKLSTGEQMVSWIHVTDFVRAIEFAIEDEDLQGPLNITAPAPVRNCVFMKTLRETLGIPFGLDHYKPLLEVAAWILRTETELTLKSRFAVPAKLLQHRFVFYYPFVDEALSDLAMHRKRTASPFDPHLLELQKP